MTNIRIKLTKEAADALLDTLPGGRDLYLWIADRFIQEYESPGAPVHTGNVPSVPDSKKDI